MTGAGQRALDRLKGFYDQLGQGNLFIDPEIFDPNIEVIWAEGMADSTVDRGVAEFAGSVARLMEGLTELSFVAERFVAHADKVLVYLEGRGTGRATGLAVSQKALHLWTFSGDLAVRIEGFWAEEEARALRTAGIDPEDATCD